jgi:membrane-bound lytic murein transglycosylase D
LGVFLTARIIVRTLILCLPILAACTSSAPKTQVKVVPPPQPRIAEEHAEAPLVEPATPPVPVQIPPNGSVVDQIALTVVEAQLRFEHGESLYSQGFLKQAKEDFDGAIDLLLDLANVYPAEPRLQHEISELVSRVHALELAALREGDGFTDQNNETAAIDDLERVETFPETVDPKLKQEVENEINEIAHDLPIEINDRVLGFLNHYTNGRGRSTIEIGLERIGRYQPMIEQILKEEGVPLDLIYLCQAESAFKPRALSRAKAKGMWQFISSRGKEYGLRQTWWVDERSDPEKSTRAAARHLKDLYQEFGDWYLAMAAYNSGPVRVEKAMERTGADNFWTLANKRALPKETINYVPNILALTIIGKNPQKYGFEVESEPPLETERVAVDKATDLRVIAEAIHLPLEDLRDLNAHVLRWTTPPDDPDFELVLPQGYGDKFKAEIATLPESKRVLFREHVVRKGETLSAIAKKYDSSITELRQANSLKAKPVLRAGQSLIIPMSGINPPQVASKRTPTKAAAKPAVTAYTVRKGDTLAQIAARFKVSVALLKEWNHLSTTLLAVGKKLIVAEPVQRASVDRTPTARNTGPSTRPVVHKVRPGDTLVSIASTYKTSVDAILSWNKENDLSVIHPGDQITIYLGESR